MKNIISKPAAKVKAGDKKKVEKNTANAKHSAPKATKGPSKAKAKSNTKKVDKPATAAKHTVAKVAKEPVKAKTKSSAAKSAATPAKERVITRLVTHGIDRHFIPEHQENPAETAIDSNKEEKAYHSKEEVALHQENQKVKAGMVSRVNQKRIFNSQGRR